MLKGRVKGFASRGGEHRTSNIELRMRKCWCGGLKNTWSNRKELKEHIEMETTEANEVNEEAFVSFCRNERQCFVVFAISAISAVKFIALSALLCGK
jgi:hypothetical protein